MLWGGRAAADKCPWPVWGALPVFQPHWVCPAHGCVLFPSTLLRLPAALQGVGPALRAVSVFGFSTKTWTRLGLRFVPSQPEQLGKPGAWWAHSPRVRCSFSPPRAQPQFPWAPVRYVCLVSILGSWPLATTLLLVVDHPESQEVFGWKLGACLQFGRGAISGAAFAPFTSPLPLPPTGDGPARRLALPFFLQTAGSIFRLVNFLSLSCYPTV